MYPLVPINKNYCVGFPSEGEGGPLYSFECSGDLADAPVMKRKAEW